MRARFRIFVGLLALLGLFALSPAGPAGAQPEVSPPPPVLSLLLTNNNPAAGETFGACAPAGTFAPGSAVRVLLGGNEIGTVTADATGGVCAEVEIPCDFPAGATRLEFVGTAPDGAPRTLGADVNVQPGTCPAEGAAGAGRARGTGLPRTGDASTAPLTAAGVGLVLIGAFAVAAARRRRTAQSIGS